ncbi:hypothetical protein H2198_007709 [Neophaeococcomyces mojaviensis]|uniref:Uncharacterized protein n=1 Tax=Neophaeococcomyces mojaviensis TaxID=3383035 RepID=A0ACC2ZZG4_9EURO|nr:hypothetical protein H2198_007709 [Knufia sp. JES_112]
MLKHLPGLPWSRSSSELNVKYIPLASPHLGHRRQVSLSSFNARKTAWFAGAGLFLLALCLATAGYFRPALRFNNLNTTDDNGPIPLGKSVSRGGREVFWWEQFPRLVGYYRGRSDVVPPPEYVPEQQQADLPFMPLPVSEPTLKLIGQLQNAKLRCSVTPPTIQAYDGLPQGMSSALLGSMEELGIDHTVCYDRINRFGPYGFVTLQENGGLDIELHGENTNLDHFNTARFRDIQWNEIQEECARENADYLRTRSRTAFIFRTWHTFNYTPYHILMLRAIVNELSLRTGGEIYIHFLVHVQDDSIPIWASDEVYNETLRMSLPEEFAGMGTLWSIAQMQLVYPPPFPESIINFSGGDVYEAYRSLHFPLQYFASRHPEFDYFWQWEMDIRVTGHYGELLDKITAWADKQPRDHLWERSSKFFIPSLYNTFANFSRSVVKETAASGVPPISGPQLPADQLLPIPPQSEATKGDDITDLITFSPIFNPEHTRWAFRDDITGYLAADRPPTRAALITASRMSRRLLLLMHEETFRNKHTMFPEMYPASIALHYGLKAVYAPITTCFDRDWPAEHANEVFNNAKLSYESLKIGMGGGGGYFHGIGGSVFGPGEHVFRGASWYSNAGFAGYLWRRWLGNENGNDEITWELGEGHGRMCLPMMMLHPIKYDA